MFRLNFTPSQSIIINKPLAELKNYLANLENWPKWSPWLFQEPDCHYTVDGNPGTVESNMYWIGKRIGEGEMYLTEIGDTSLTFKLNIMAPWRSQSTVTMEFSELDNNATTLTWTMHGTLPFFLFFMKKTCCNMVNCDYKRGLEMLKELLETGSLPTSTEVGDKQQQNEFYWLGITNECAFENIASCMEKEFETMYRHVETGALPKPQFAGAFYHDYNFAKNTCRYTSFLAFDQEVLPTKEIGLTPGYVVNHVALYTKHKGAYRYLGNSWNGAISEQRSRKLKPNKHVPMYEIYRTMPDENTDDAELHTDIYVPLAA